MHQEPLFEEKKPNIFVRFFKGIGSFLFDKHSGEETGRVVKNGVRNSVRAVGKAVNGQKEPRKKIVKV